MALSDILNRIADDSESEAASIISAAESAAGETLAAARKRAEAESAVTLAQGTKDATAQADTILASARLAARDNALRARRGLIDEVLVRVIDALAGLPDDRYAELLARLIARVARGGEAVHVAAADSTRLGGLRSAVDRVSGSSLALTYPEEPAPVEHGVVLRAERAMVDLSLEAIVAERRADLEMLAFRELFGQDGEG